MDQTPTQFLFLQPFPDRAASVTPGGVLLHWNTAVTNTIIDEGSDRVREHSNLETVRSVLDLRVGMLPGLEAGVQVPFLYLYEGVLDGLIRGVEGIFGAERITRKRDPGEAFVYDVRRPGRDGEVLVSGKEGTFGLGDVSFQVKGELFVEGPWHPAVAVRAAVKIPTGDASRALGSGATDWGLGLLAEKSLGAWSFYGNADWIVPGQAFGEQGLDLQPFWGAMGAVEFRATESVGVVLQVRTDTLVLFRKQVTDVLLGLNWAPTPRLAFQLGLAEDVLGSAPYSADLSLFLNASRRW